MAKKDTIYTPRAKQMSLPFDHSGTYQHSAGSFRRTYAVIEALKTTLKQSSLSREQIADEMSRLLGEEVSKNHIANWAAESKNGWRMPLEWAAAFSVITGDYSVIKAVFEGSGINILNDSEMAFYEIGKAIEEKRESDARLKETRNRLNALRMQGRV